MRHTRRRRAPRVILAAMKPETVNRRIKEGWLLVGMINDQRFLVSAAKTARDAVKTDVPS